MFFFEFFNDFLCFFLIGSYEFVLVAKPIALTLILFLMHSLGDHHRSEDCVAGETLKSMASKPIPSGNKIFLTICYLLEKSIDGFVVVCIITSSLISLIPVIGSSAFIQVSVVILVGPVVVLIIPVISSILESSPSS